MPPSNGFASAFTELFGSILKPKGCDACGNKAFAFGIRVCRLSKPEPKDGAECAFWRKPE